jgi:hypothetical protein
MESNFVPYQIAVDMKSIGFDELCFGWYADNGVYNGYSMKNSTMDELNMIKNSCSAPLYQQCWRWFREKYNFHHYIEPIHRNSKIQYEYCVVNSSEDEKEFKEDDIICTYKEAELECLVKLISIVKEKKL